MDEKKEIKPFFAKAWTKKLILGLVALFGILFMLGALVSKCNSQLFAEGETVTNIFQSISFDIVFDGVDLTSFYPVMCLVVSMVFAFATVLTIVFALLLFTKNKHYSSFLYINTVAGILSIAIGGFFSFLSVPQIIWYLMSVLVSLFGVIFNIIFIKNAPLDEEEAADLKREREDAPDVEQDRPEVKPAFIATFVTNIISTLIVFTCFFVPSVKFGYDGEFSQLVIIRGLVSSSENAISVIDFVSFLVMLGLFTFAILSNLGSWRYFHHRDRRFSKKTRFSVYYNLVVTLIFFLFGYISAYLLAQEGWITSTIAYIPFILQTVCTVLHGYFNSRNTYSEKERKRARRPSKYRFIIMLFIILFSASTIVGLGLDYIRVVYRETDVFSISAFEIMGTYKKLSEGYAIVAFLVLATIVICLALDAISLASLFSKSKTFKNLALVTIVVNAFCLLVLGLIGKYYEITEGLNVDIYESLIEFRGGSVMFDPESEDFKTKSLMLFAGFADIGLAVALAIVKPFTAIDNFEATDMEISTDDPISVELVDKSAELANKSFEELSQDPEGPILDENNMPVDRYSELEKFDACPAFTELDALKPRYDQLNSLREKAKYENCTLPGLVQFIVNYAAESRLHLSYNVETIATFIAGLGATKLTILQGMSGTGKTSLPKIFMEAIYGNCEIVEVESSWKDKNELLGYYNDFSKAFTPKKFTQALYRAASNPDVITFIVLDELNLSRIEYYFSDFLSLMEHEPQNREIKLLNVKLYNIYDHIKHSYRNLKNDHTLHVAENIWFIGTANRDESTFEISDKVYDRAHTMNFNKRAPKIRSYTEPLDKKYVSYPVLNELLENAKKADFELESVDYIKDVEAMLAPYNISFGNRIMKQMEEFVKVYCACFSNKRDVMPDAIETILLSKVVAKLEFKSIENRDELIEGFNRLHLYRCAEFIEKLQGDF